MYSSDRNLQDFLCKCDSESLHCLIQCMKSNFSGKSRKLSSRYNKANDIPEPSTCQRRTLAREVLELLQWYGSNSALHVGRKLLKKDICPYHKILHDTAKVLNRSRKKKNREKLPRVASVDEWENLICALLIKSTIKGKTPSEIAEMLMEAGLEKDSAISAAKQFSPGGVIGVSLPVMVKMLGKKTVTAIIGKIVVNLTYRKLGKEAALQMAKRLMIKFPQKFFAKLVSIIGWALIAVDSALFLTSPARRITVPTVSIISALRSLERIEQNDKTSDSKTT